MAGDLVTLDCGRSSSRHRPCSVCTSPRRPDIEEWLAEGHKVSTISRKFGISRWALRRHLGHRQERDQQAALVASVSDCDTSEIATSTALSRKLHRIELELDRLAREAAKVADNRLALLVVRERTRCIEVEAKLQQSARVGASVTVNVFDEATATRMAEVFLARRRRVETLEGECPKVN